MKKNLLSTIMFCAALFLNAQNGDTMNDAILVDGTEVSVNVLDYNSSTQSGLTPSCSSSEDVFYKHTTTSGQNKMTIGMVSAGLTLLSTINYQIFVVPNDNPGQLTELDCDHYTVFAIVGGSFEFVIEDVDAINTYYLRVYKTSNVGGSLTDLLNGTTLTMTSEYDSTLSINNEEQQELKYVVADDLIS